MIKNTSFKHYFLLGVAVLFTFYTFAKITGLLNVFSLPTESMMPNYAPNSFIFSCNWISPKRNDVATFYDTSLAIPHLRAAKRDMFFGRIIAEGGERLEIVEGQVLINGQASGAGLHLYQAWQLSENDYNANRPRFKSTSIPPMNLGDSLVVTIGNLEAAEIKRHVPMYLFDVGIFSKNAENIWGPQAANWTLNNFGPVTVPDGYVFILGDNRTNSEDSRHRGFVPKKDLIGKVLN